MAMEDKVRYQREMHEYHNNNNHKNTKNQRSENDDDDNDNSDDVPEDVVPPVKKKRNTSHMTSFSFATFTTENDTRKKK